MTTIKFTLLISLIFVQVACDQSYKKSNRKSGFVADTVNEDKKKKVKEKLSLIKDKITEEEQNVKDFEVDIKDINTRISEQNKVIMDIDNNTSLDDEAKEESLNFENNKLKELNEELSAAKDARRYKEYVVSILEKKKDIYVNAERIIEKKVSIENAEKQSEIETNDHAKSGIHAKIEIEKEKTSELTEELIKEYNKLPEKMRKIQYLEDSLDYRIGDYKIVESVDRGTEKSLEKFSKELKAVTGKSIDEIKRDGF